jgi:hypothetical protein
MFRMTPKITPEMRAALARCPGEPIEVEDDQTHKVYFLVDPQSGRDAAEQWVRAALQVGFDAAARGAVVPFDAEAIKTAGRQRHSA